MAFNEIIADRIREALQHQLQVEEKMMFQGLGFMVNDKLCICLRGDVLLCRIDPAAVEAELEKGHCRQMIHNKRVMKGYVYVDENGYRKKKDFDHWINLCLEFNKVARSSKTKGKGKD